ncbi:hypothetical protein C9374_000446 [Naegleria lovaniensis]|uniref:Uncharacterized protein n=1 Tax=Naegleria lovaniensis TaxID=51637 RepID=A0AA88GSW8_NAELO|nr:uncharacterized protein C9374_000446 [Naegleria lovaniensis]KAG2388282.1 hypothetical protein C9374_000446 [Naegleria lovaniensis]
MIKHEKESPSTMHHTLPFFHAKMNSSQHYISNMEFIPHQGRTSNNDHTMLQNYANNHHNNLDMELQTYLLQALLNTPSSHHFTNQTILSFLYHLIDKALQFSKSDLPLRWSALSTDDDQEIDPAAQDIYPSLLLSSQPQHYSFNEPTVMPTSQFLAQNSFQPLEYCLPEATADVWFPPADVVNRFFEGFSSKNLTRCSSSTPITLENHSMESCCGFSPISSLSGNSSSLHGQHYVESNPYQQQPSPPPSPVTEFIQKAMGTSLLKQLQPLTTSNNNSKQLPLKRCHDHSAALFSQTLMKTSTTPQSKITKTRKSSKSASASFLDQKRIKDIVLVEFNSNHGPTGRTSQAQTLVDDGVGQ